MPRNPPDRQKKANAFVVVTAERSDPAAEQSIYRTLAAQDGALPKRSILSTISFVDKGYSVTQGVLCQLCPPESGPGAHRTPAEFIFATTTAALLEAGGPLEQINNQFSKPGGPLTICAVSIMDTGPAVPIVSP